MLLKKIIIFLILSLLYLNVSAQTLKIDSLQKLLTITPENDSKINLYNKIIAHYLYKYNNLNSAKEYATKQLILAKKLNNKTGIAHAYITYGVYYREQSNYLLSLDYLFKALKIFEELKDNAGTGTAYYRIGSVYLIKGEYSRALDYLTKSEKIQEALKDKKTLKSIYNNIAIVYNSQGKIQPAMNYHFKALKINEELNDSMGISSTYANIGLLFWDQKKSAAAIEYYLKALRIKKAIGDKRGLSIVSNNIGDIYIHEKRYEEALNHFLESLKYSEQSGNIEGIGIAQINIGFLHEQQNNLQLALKYQSKALEIMKKIDNKGGMQDAYNNLGIIYEKEKKYAAAIDNYTKSLAISKDTRYKEGMCKAYENLASAYKKINDYKKAFEYISLFYMEKDSLINTENFQQLTEINTRYETEKKEKEIQLLTKDQILNEKTLKQQKIIRLALIIGLVLLFVILSLVYKRYRFKQKANLLLEEQKKEIKTQNIMITDSIDYAKNIQEAILPNDNYVKCLLPQSFIFFKPKSIVSGDFYWIKEKQKKIICIAADCTGHGVPGAFMSLLGINMLDNISNRENPVAANILNLLNSEIIATLSQSTTNKELMEHGMDATVLIIDKNNMQAQYAGAHNPLYFIRNGELNEIKANKIAIGSNEQTLFTNHTFQLQKGDAFYLFTDGFPDQIGGPNKKKFYYQPFKELLVTIHQSDMAEQKQLLDKTITKWRGQEEQIDDILIMGIKI